MNEVIVEIDDASKTLIIEETLTSGSKYRVVVKDGAARVGEGDFIITVPPQLAAELPFELREPAPAVAARARLSAAEPSAEGVLNTSTNVLQALAMRRPRMETMFPCVIHSTTNGENVATGFVRIRLCKVASGEPTGAAILYRGEKGATFTPAVSDEGVISWTNDRDLENPPDVDLMHAVREAKDSAVAAVGEAKDGALDAVGEAKDGAIDAVGEAKEEAVAAVGKAKEEAIEEIEEHKRDVSFAVERLQATDAAQSEALAAQANALVDVQRTADAANKKALQTDARVDLAIVKADAALSGVEARKDAAQSQQEVNAAQSEALAALAAIIATFGNGNRLAGLSFDFSTVGGIVSALKISLERLGASVSGLVE